MRRSSCASRARWVGRRRSVRKRGEIFDEFASLTTGTLRLLRREPRAPEGRRAVCSGRIPGPDHPGTARLYDGAPFATPSGRARFVPVEYDAPVEATDGGFP